MPPMPAYCMGCQTVCDLCHTVVLLPMTLSCSGLGQSAAEIAARTASLLDQLSDCAVTAARNAILLAD